MRHIRSILIVFLFAGGLFSACKKADPIIRNTANGLSDIFATLEGKGGERLFEPRYSVNKDTIYFDIPYFYPVNSDNEVDLSKIILRGTIPADATMSPALGTLMNLTQPVSLEITSGSGEKSNYVVVAKKIGDLTLRKATIEYSDGTGTQQLEGIITNNNEVIFYVIPGTDVSQAKLTIEINPHSTSSVANNSVINLTQEVPLTVTGVEGSTRNYVLKAVEPTKLAYGVGISRLLWRKSAAEITGFAASDNSRSMAVSGDYIVIATSTTPSVYKIYNRFTGAFVQDMVPPPGGIRSFAILNDSLGHILVTSWAPANSRFFVYRYQDPFDAAPVKLIEWINTASGGIGRRVNVYGDVNGNAVITATAGQANVFFKWTIENGVTNPSTSAPQMITYQSMTGPTPYPFYWEVQPVSAASNGNYFVNYPAEIALVNGGANQRILAFSNDPAAVGSSHMAMDYFEFNNAKYLASAPFLGGVNTRMGMSLYDVTDQSKFSLAPSNPEFSKFRVFNSAHELTASANGNGAGDICVILSSDKERVCVYTLLTNGGVMAHEFTKYAP